jgi:hypothetical protein
VTTQSQQDSAAAGGGAPSKQERRRHPRFVVDIPVRLTAEGATFAGHLRDVCRDAAWVESDRPCGTGTQIAVAMELPGTGGPMQIDGQVVRVGAGEKAPHGMAILFKELASAAATRIDFFIALQDY